MCSATPSPQQAQVRVVKMRAFSGRGSLGSVTVNSSSSGAVRICCLRSYRLRGVWFRFATTRKPSPEARS